MQKIFSIFILLTLSSSLFSITAAPFKHLSFRLTTTQTDSLKSALNEDTYQKMEHEVLQMLESELADTLYYHSVEHTKDVIFQAERLGKLEKLGQHELLLLKVAALFHDSGFTLSSRNHEEKGVEIARQMLLNIELSNEDFHQIKLAILATKTPQAPITQLGEILCDADLDYLGRPEVEEIANRLFKELKAMGKVKDKLDWNKMQVSFIKQHRYFTSYNQTDREPNKQIYLNTIIAAINQEN